MSNPERLIAEVRKQRSALAHLIERLAARSGFEPGDCYVFETEVREVERGLRRLNRLMIDEWTGSLS